MRIISFNANGIRAAARKGFFDWLAEQDADVVCIQETKARFEQLEDDPTFFPKGYYCYYEDATNRKGYAGVALYARRKPDKIIRGMQHEEFDAEGRYLEARFDRLAVASLYAPSGSSGDHRQASKERYMTHYLDWLRRKRKSRYELIICGDWNIAHKKIDLKNWRSNQKNSGFLPHEREWMSALFDRAGYVDAFREVNQEPEQYTWWSNRGNAWANNVGWRIDYHVITPALKDKVKDAFIYREQKFSDHAPLTLDYDLNL